MIWKKSWGQGGRPPLDPLLIITLTNCYHLKPDFCARNMKPLTMWIPLKKKASLSVLVSNLGKNSTHIHINVKQHHNT